MICKSPRREKAKKSPEKNENSPEWMGHWVPYCKKGQVEGIKYFNSKIGERFWQWDCELQCTGFVFAF